MLTAPVEKKYHDGILCLLRAVIAKNRVRPVCKKRILTGLQSRLESSRAIQQQEVMSGFSRMQCCRDALSFLDENGWRRSYHQRLFHDDFIRACTRIFWKREAPGKFSREQCEILRRNNWSHIQQEVLISTPRRFGKTISVSMFGAAMLYSAPGVEISIYATCKRISQKLLRNVVKFFELICKNDLKSAGFTTIRSNMEELVVRSTHDVTDIRIINSYPSKLFFCIFGVHVFQITWHRMTEHNEIREPRLDLTQAVRDTLGRARLSVSYHNLKASGKIPESAQVKPAPASDVALIAAAYEYLQSSGQLPPPDSDAVVCVHSSDELTDFFVSNGVGDCQEIVCKFIGIESVEDLKLITAADLHSSRFSTWANDSMTMVQYKKLIKAFS